VTPYVGDNGDTGISMPFLATSEATMRERRLAWGVVVASALIFVLALPYAKVKLVEVPAFIPAYISGLVIISLVTAVILVGQFVRLRSLALLALCAGYFFDAGIAVPYLMSFPGVLAPQGVIGGGGQTTAWLYTFWHAGMPLFVLAYALLGRRSGKIIANPSGVMLGTAAFVLAVLVVMVLAATAGHELLPPMMAGNVKAPSAFYILGSAWLFSGAALFVLWRKGIRTSLDVWVSVAMVAWIFDIALAAVFNGGRYDLGYYAGRLYGLLAISFVLVAMLLEITGLNGRVVAAAAKLSDKVKETNARVQSTEAQLRQAQKMEAIGNLTGGMAHDFNNLLTVIIGNLDILVAHRKDDPEVQQLSGEALEAALRGADLTRRLLAFARQQPLKPEHVDINALISNITRLLGRTLGESIEITLDLDPQAWPVVIDAAQLDAALTNLATNARDAMPGGGSLIIVTGNRHLDADYAAQHADVTAGDYAMVEVSDTGSGMPPDVAARIFEPFFTTKEHGKGTGLGLSMVYGFMKQSGGHINLYSEPGIGTTFRLYLPRGEAVKPAADQPAATTALEGRGETVLAVEDNPSLRRVVVRQLHELGYRVLEADNAPTALDLLDKENIELLFTDVVMSGGMNGIELARQAVQKRPQIKVLIMSGFPNAKFNGNGGLSTPWRLLNKPYRKEDLARALREVLDDSRA
jgi:signal transduction histidine kinase/ActR/RegA family two-component response regulator